MDPISLLLCVVLISLAIYRFLTSTFDHWKNQDVPYMPNPLPGFGHLLPTMTLQENLGCLFQRIYNQTSASVIGIYYLRKPALIIRDPELVKSVLQSNFSSFHENMVNFTEKLDPVYSRDPFYTINRDVWKEGRARIVSHLSNKKLKYLSLIIEEVCGKMSAYVDKKILNDCYECGLKEFFLKCTGETVANAAFGIQGNHFEDNSKERPFASLANMIYTPSWINGIKVMLVLYFPSFSKLLKIKILTTESQILLKDIVKKIIKQRKEENVAPNDYLQFCIDSNEDDLNSILSDLLIFYDDVYETVSSTLAAVFYHLSSSQEIQEKLRKHLSKTSGDKVSYESQKNMDYLEQVIFEAMRLTTPVGFFAKLCTDKITMEGYDGVECNLKPGDLVIISTLGLHLDSKHWSDPQIFDPERFSSENQAKRHKYTFLPFGEGPRMCVGVRLAIMMVKLVTASMLLKYSVEFSSRTKLPLVREPTQVTYIKGDLWVKFKKLDSYDG